MQLAQGNPLEMVDAIPGKGTPPAWVHILPRGRFQTNDGRGPYTLNDPQAIITNTLLYHGKLDIPVDYDHQLLWTRDNGKPALAAGWVKELAVRPDGIWGRVEWTDAAAARIAAKEYRYISPVFRYDTSMNVQKIESVALVNNPALVLTAIASALPGFSMQPSMTAEEKAVCRQLGLSDATFSGTRHDLASARAEASRHDSVEDKVCAQLGISTADYRRTKGQN